MMMCPKCRQPLDGDEAYICCAGATLAWRCEDCGKVSEGFAFPYGLCPHCSGRLAILDDRRIEDEAGLSAIRMAFEIELGGRAFYTRAAGEAQEPAMRDLFGRLAEMEGEHMATLARRYHAEVPEPSEAFRPERASIFAGIDNHPDDPANLFRIAIACEERAVRFFDEHGERAADGSAERQLYRELAAEDREHVALLTTEYDLWRSGRTGLL